MTRFHDWFFEGIRPVDGPHATPVHTAPWWKVMCLTGVDYFSTLGYQPGIAFVAAGALAPIATLVLVVADAVRRTAGVSPRRGGEPERPGQHLHARRPAAALARQGLRALLLGFAATDFVITITLSAADATEHLIHNPFVPASFDHPVA